jgi:hypothetical protein
MVIEFVWSKFDLAPKPLDTSGANEQHLRELQKVFWHLRLSPIFRTKAQVRISHQAGKPALASVLPPAQVRACVQRLDYSLKTEKTCFYWKRFLVPWPAQNSSVRHPRAMGCAVVEGFLFMRSNERQVSPAMHWLVLSQRDVSLPRGTGSDHHDRRCPRRALGAAMGRVWRSL